MIHIISRLAHNTTTFFVTSRKCHSKPHKNITWAKPGPGWTKLNYDGSCKHKSGRSSIGGIFRDDEAGFLLAYAESIGQGNSVLAELAAIERGLELALDNGWDQVWVEGDSKSVVDIVLGKKVARCVKMQTHFERVNEMLPLMKRCVVTHNYREANRAADRLAKMGHRLANPRIWRGVPPCEVARIVGEDAEGKTFMRRR